MTTLSLQLYVLSGQYTACTAWRNTQARSCKLLAQEIRDHRHSLPASERSATIRILVRSNDHNQDYALTHAVCPAKDLTILRLDYTVLLSDFYCTELFPQFQCFTWGSLEPVMPDCLPNALDLQIFLRFKQDESNPPDEKTYLERVKLTCQMVQDSHQARYILPKVQRLVGFTFEP